MYLLLVVDDGQVMVMMIIIMMTVMIYGCNRCLNITYAYHLFVLFCGLIS